MTRELAFLPVLPPQFLPLTFRSRVKGGKEDGGRVGEEEVEERRESYRQFVDFLLNYEALSRIYPGLARQVIIRRVRFLVSLMRLSRPSQ